MNIERSDFRSAYRRLPRAALYGVVALMLVLGAIAAPSFGQEGDNPPAGRSDVQRYYSAPSDWAFRGGGSLNISAYIYRDSNRDGVYDVGDRPLASVVVEMVAPDGSKSVARSNVNGFANFRMSMTEQDAPVSAPGTYHFRVVPPPGWTITSENVEQSITFLVLPGAIADIVAPEPPGMVGLAPELRITGRVAAKDGNGAIEPAPGASVSAHAPGGGRIEVAVEDDGTFSFPASDGEWRIEASRDGATLERTVIVRRTPVRLSAMVFGAPEVPAAPHRVEIDFENITQSTLAKIPSGTAGVNWDYLNVTEMLLYNGEGYVNTLMSGHYVGYNSSGHPVKVFWPEGFDFVGAYLGVAWGTAEGEELLVEAWRDGERVGQEVISLSSLGPVWFDADYRDIDQLNLSTRHFWQFVVDDMVIRTGGTR